MSAYLVERYVSRAVADDLAGLTSGLADAARRAARAGRPARLAYSILVPEDELCLHVVTALSAADVTQLVSLASIPVERVVAAAVLDEPSRP